MGFRFQRRVKLFPGVRLNFSRGGISTTIGVRGASVTLGRRGTYMNVGVPGTGVSYRTRIDSHGTPSPPHHEFTPSVPVPLPPATPPSMLSGQDLPVAGAIRSAPVHTLTSAGLGDLKRLINEAALKRAELLHTIPQLEHAVAAARSRLRRAQRFIVRLFTQRKIPSLVTDIAAAEAALAEARAHVAGCSIEIDFAFGQPALDAFAALTRGFAALCSCQKIWDITASVAVDRIKERTTAARNVTRTSVTFSRARSDIIDSEYQALYLTNANGNDIYVYPGVILIRRKDAEFALIDVRELQVRFSQVPFVERESVPSDAEAVGKTWDKTNKDGSPDRRFNGNFQIPIVRYGEIEFRSSTGLYEVYHISNAAAAENFVASIRDLQTEMAAMEASSTGKANTVAAHPEDEADEGAAEPAAVPPLTPLAPRFLFLDWAALILLAVITAAVVVSIAHAPAA